MSTSQQTETLEQAIERLVREIRSETTCDIQEFLESKLRSAMLLLAEKAANDSCYGCNQKWTLDGMWHSEPDSPRIMKCAALAIRRLAEEELKR